MFGYSIVTIKDYLTWNKLEFKVLLQNLLTQQLSELYSLDQISASVESYLSRSLQSVSVPNKIHTVHFIA